MTISKKNYVCSFCVRLCCYDLKSILCGLLDNEINGHVYSRMCVFGKEPVLLYTYSADVSAEERFGIDHQKQKTKFEHLLANIKYVQRMVCGRCTP